MNRFKMRGTVPTARRPTSTAPKKSTSEKTSASMKRPRVVNAPVLDCTLGSSTSTSGDTARNSRPRPPSSNGAHRKRMPIKVRPA